MSADRSALLTPSTRDALRERFAQEPGALLERVADEFDVSVLDVALQVPPEHCTMVTGARLEDVLNDLTEWGPVMFLVHLPTFIIEVKTAIPPASPGRGYLNFRGDTPLGGHLRADACEAIGFVDRPFMGRRSCAILFFDHGGSCIFKVFVARDAEGALLADQAARFEALRFALAAASPYSG